MHTINPAIMKPSSFSPSAPKMSDKTLLTIAETAQLLNCSAGFVRKRIALSESSAPGGWPKTVYVNLQPNGAKSLFRINKSALEQFLHGDSVHATESVVSPDLEHFDTSFASKEAKIEEQAELSATCAFPGF